ncbi:MAG: hypothetical protein A2X36_10740 [Elusimicrobia bacterium GWA2_69_24]|nr:MAG: hypothetical protein A2X36_10740 [Elusimicrobia bacterium GWA2_69_24]HBL18492.1 hypothetical protein [Elusimicrobiota bacterium]
MKPALRPLPRVLLRHGLSRPPFLESRRIDELYLMLTLECNLRCRACILWGGTGACQDPALLRRHAGGLPRAVLKRVVDEIAPLRPGQLNLAGGEPLLSPHWLAVARHARRRGIPVTLTTNGVLLNRYWREVLGAVDQVNLSLDGPPSIADVVRPGKPGYFRDMLLGLKALARARRGGRKPLLRVLCVISEKNCGRLVELVDFLEKAEVGVDQYYFQHLIFNSPATLRRHARVCREEFGAPLSFWKGYGLSPGRMDLDLLHEELECLRRRHPDVRFSTELDRDGLRRYYASGRARPAPSYCLGPWNQPNLLPDGTVWSCPDLPLGNVLRDDFAAIWNGAAARALRRRTLRKLFPACAGCFSCYGDRKEAA